MAVSLSLVIPTYNRAHLIAETLDYALRQTVPFAEIIVVDDGSTDHTVEVLGPYEGRIKLIRSANGGVQAARNRGVAAASSEYVTLCDSDDLLEPQFVETMGAWLDAHRDIDAAYTNIRKFRGDELESDHLSQAPDSFMQGARLSDGFYRDIPDLYLRLFTIHFFYPTGCTLKKAFYEGIGGFNPMFNRVGAEDGEFTLRAAAAGKIACCAAPLARIRRHDGNDSADALYMIVGSAQILEYASQHHRNVQQYVPALRDMVSELRLQAANDAFAKAKFDIAERMFVHPHAGPMGLKFHLKKTITRLPAPLRRLAWKATQAR
ncbi:glycosyltransferase family 2 protein [Massilia sp. IC2-477]|uniref:glycosyltransferase family A protein n=1 Tax=Massilia sp. IC2-477 TaxID=2887198 RepID=UPI001D0FF0A0|nr:glycosyltransferase family A protein [Massilia sp. IC2-477]MCC2956548.1 glycosyltransferase family 2 protein [Massilia sp. IC2-477]